MVLAKHYHRNLYVSILNFFVSPAVTIVNRVKSQARKKINIYFITLYFCLKFQKFFLNLYQLHLYRDNKVKEEGQNYRFYLL